MSQKQGMVTDALESGFKKRSQLLKWCIEANRMKFNTDNRYKHMYVYVYLYICVYIYVCVHIYSLIFKKRKSTAQVQGSRNLGNLPKKGLQLF